MEDYKKISNDARKKILELIYKAGTSHIGSNFSCVDIMTVIFENIDLDRDKFVLSAGWKAAALYYFLWRKGRITEEELNSYCQEGSKFIGLSEPIIPDILIAGGSMGLGLPGAVGLALAKKLNNEEGKVYCLMSDGEMQCGTTWEAALIAAHHRLNNLVVVVDYNGFQAMGRTNEVLFIEDLRGKFQSFGFSTIEIDGHDFVHIDSSLTFAPLDSPKVIIAQTIKGSGVSFMENNNDWHYRHLDKENYELAQSELG